MAIVDPSHPKAQMAGPSFPIEETDDLPSYEPSIPPHALEDDDAAAEAGRHASGSTSNDAGPSSSSSSGRPVPAESLPGVSFSPEPLALLNPEAVKKLSADASAGGRQLTDYGFLEQGEVAVADLGGAERLPLVPPPSFAQNEHRPSYEIDSMGNIVSHDHLLNTSPAALLRFLRLHCTSPPSLTLRLRGVHKEKRTETYFETHNGRRRTRTRDHEVEVEDFSFTIDASDDIEAGLGSARGVGGVRGVLYEVGGWEAVYRGGSLKTRAWRESDGSRIGTIRLPESDQEAVVGERAERREWVRPTFRDSRRMAKEKAERDSRGFPSFIHPDCLLDMEDDSRPLEQQMKHPSMLFRSHFVDLTEVHSAIPFSMNRLNAGPLPPIYEEMLAERGRREEDVRSVVQTYCSSEKQLKELRVEKEVYGWNWRLLEAGLRATIDTAHYQGKVHVEFCSTPSTLIIRPENHWSRIFSMPWWAKVVLWLLCIYPILLLVELFLGDRYNNLRVSFPLTRWRRLPLPNQASVSTSDGSKFTSSEALEIARSLTARSPKVQQLPADKSWIYLTGSQEGEWLKKWERTIVYSVRSGKRGPVKLEEVNGGKPDPRSQLRGYSG